jgi:uridine kinase
VKIIGVGGISGSGKSYFVDQIDRQIQKGFLSIISFDHYYKPKVFQKTDTNGMINFDLPESVDSQKLLYDLELLKNGKTVHLQQYTYNNTSLTGNMTTISPTPIVIVEGIFVFHFKLLFEQLDFKIFMESNLEDTLKRRVARDTKERNISESEVIYQWNHHVIPSYQSYLLPYKHHADMIIKNEGYDLSVKAQNVAKIILDLRPNE